jgi:DNA-binding beta-propeller fold protein YncE
MHRDRLLPHLASLALMCTLAAPAVAATGDLYVTSDASNLTRRYDGATGNYFGVFSPSGAAGGQMAVHFVPAVGRVLIGHAFNGVEERDVATGSLIKTYNPGGGWQWAALLAPTNEVFIGSNLTNDVRAYDLGTGAFIRLVAPVPFPADMTIGPDGNLYVASWNTNSVFILDPVTGGIVAPNVFISANGLPNDIAFDPATGDMFVSAMVDNKVYRYQAGTFAFLGTLTHAFWGNPHGLAFSPTTGNLLVVDGVTGQVHEFDITTMSELNPAWLTPTPGDKIVDLAFEPAMNPTPARATSWGKIKSLYR